MGRKRGDGWRWAPRPAVPGCVSPRLRRRVHPRVKAGRHRRVSGRAAPLPRAAEAWRPREECQPLALAPTTRRAAPARRRRRGRRGRNRALAPPSVPRARHLTRARHARQRPGWPGGARRGWGQRAGGGRKGAGVADLPGLESGLPPPSRPPAPRAHRVASLTPLAAVAAPPPPPPVPVPPVCPWRRRRPVFYAPRRRRAAAAATTLWPACTGSQGGRGPQLGTTVRGGGSGSVLSQPLCGRLPRRRRSRGARGTPLWGCGGAPRPCPR